MRVAPVAHVGELLGFIVASRRRDGEPFTESEDRVLTELARQVALALHNVQLDTALQASLDELHVRNEELRVAGPIVAAGDAERRKLERNLHDGAQQHLVALAVKLRLARERSRTTRTTRPMIEEIGATSRTPSRSCARWPTASSRRCSCRAGWPRRCRRPRPGRAADDGGRRGVGRDSAERSRRPCTSAARGAAERRQARRRRRHRPGTVAERDGRWRSRSPTTAPGSTPGRRRRPRLRQHGGPARRVRGTSTCVGARRRHHSQRHVDAPG